MSHDTILLDIDFFPVDIGFINNIRIKILCV